MDVDLEADMKDILVSCTYVNDGCKMKKIPLFTIEQHEKECGYKPVKCENFGCNLTKKMP